MGQRVCAVGTAAGVSTSAPARCKVSCEYSADVVTLGVLRRLCYRLSLRGVSERCLLEGGPEFMHESVRDWKVELAPWSAYGFRKRRL